MHNVMDHDAGAEGGGDGDCADGDGDGGDGYRPGDGADGNADGDGDSGDGGDGCGDGHVAMVIDDGSDGDGGGDCGGGDNSYDGDSGDGHGDGHGDQVDTYSNLGAGSWIMPPAGFHCAFSVEPLPSLEGCLLWVAFFCLKDSVSLVRDSNDAGSKTTL